MRRIIFLKYIIFCVTVLAMFSCKISKDFFVANYGNDSNSGTKEQPFCSVKRACEAVRKYKAKYPDARINIFFREGEYSFKESIEFCSDDSGSPGKPVVYQSYNGEKVIFQGGLTIPLEYVTPVTDKNILKIVPQQVRDNIYVIDLKTIGINNYGTLKPRGFRRPYYPMPLELFINSESMVLSRWPNAENVKIDKDIERGSIPRNGDFSNKGGKFTFKSKGIKKWQMIDDLWISGFFYYGYADDAVRVKSIDFEKRMITTEQATMYGFGAGIDFRAFYFYNLLDELDIPNEYFLDRKSGKLYFSPPENEKIDKIQISIFETPLLVFDNASHIYFKNITIENTRGIGVYIEGGENIIMDSCVIRNIGEVAVCIGKGVEPFYDYKHGGTGVPISRKLGSWHEHIYDNSAFNRQAGKNNGVRNCVIYNIGSGAISLGGGDRIKLISANNFVKNCKIYNFNRIEKSYRSGVNIDGVGNIIENCEIFNSSGSAIYMHGNDHLIQYNEIHNTLQQADDMGTIYIGRDPSEYGNVIRYNYFHHNGNSTKGIHGTNVIHLDDASCGVRIYSNIFYKNDHLICINGGYNHEICNNVFLDNRVSLPKHRGIMAGWNTKNWKDYTRTQLLHKRLRKGIDITKSPYAEKYPDLLKIYQAPADARRQNLISNNICINSGTLDVPEPRKRDPNQNNYGNILKNNYEAETNNGVIDTIFFKIEDKNILSEMKNFKTIPFEKMGIIKNEN